MTASVELQSLTNREVLGRAMLMSGIPAIALGIMFWVLIATMAGKMPPEAFAERYEIGGYALPFGTWFRLMQAAILVLPPLLFISQHYFMYRGKLVRCRCCGKVRFADAIARLARLKRCETCHHEL